MQSKDEIKSEKILIKDIFKMWFSIPEYQRPYVWGYDEIHDLMDDLSYALREKPDSEYFMGSFVFQVKPADPEKGQKYNENDLLDGQQRLTTFLLLMAVIRDISDDSDVKRKCQEYIYQRADKIENIPERVRLVFMIREEVQTFIDKYIKVEGGTNDEETLAKEAQKVQDVSVRNIAKAILEIKSFFQMNGDIKVDELLHFLANNVLLIYVATENLKDAFRLFMILNDRGIPLRNSDILKTLNIGALEAVEDKIKYAKMWEEAEGELGDDFDRFLNHVRTILVKEKARATLLQEFEDKIYEPKEKDKTTGEKKPVLLKKGKATFELIEKYLRHYNTLFSGENSNEIGNNEFDNLIKVMQVSLPATDWVPPLLRYFDKFGYELLMEFLIKLDNKFSADWVGQKTPTDRIEAMNDVIKAIEVNNTAEDLRNSQIFGFDEDSFLRVLDGQIYGKRFTKYILLKLDYCYQNHDQKMHIERLSVEHILPRNPKDESQWVEDFTEEEREEWTDRLGNLVLITRRKNSALSNKDFDEKKDKYFANNIETCPNSLRVLQKYDQWTPSELKENSTTVVVSILNHYGIDLNQS